MDFEQFKFIYEDLKQQLREIPSLPLLLKSIEKTTRKLDCINLYSNCDRKEFDLQLFQRDTFNELAELLKQLSGLQPPKAKVNNHQSTITDLQRRIQKIKLSKMQAFDKLDRMQQALTSELEVLVDEDELDSPQPLQDQIKEVEQDEQEGIQPQNKQGSRVQALKKEIDELNKKISRLNRGKGRWFDGDHADFVKIYNRCAGDAQRILQEGMKMLGMKNTQITDHLQVYQNYLQFEKQKRLATQQFKSIRMLEEQLKKEQKLHGQTLKQVAAKQKKKLIQLQNIKKRQMIEQFRKKKAQEHQKLLRQAEKSKQAVKNSKKVSVDKKRQIEQRNKRLIQQKQEQFKKSSNSAAKPAPLLPKPQIIKPIIPIPIPKKGI